MAINVMPFKLERGGRAESLKAPNNLINKFTFEPFPLPFKTEGRGELFIYNRGFLFSKGLLSLKRYYPLKDKESGEIRGARVPSIVLKEIYLLGYKGDLQKFLRVEGSEGGSTDLKEIKRSLSLSKGEERLHRRR